MPENQLQTQPSVLQADVPEGGILGNIELVIAGGSFEGKIEGTGVAPVVDGNVDVCILGGDFSHCPGIYACSSDGTSQLSTGSSRLEVVGDALDGFSGVISGGILASENKDGSRKLVIGGEAGNLSRAKLWDLDKVEIEANSNVTMGANIQGTDLVAHGPHARFDFEPSSATDEVGPGSTLELAEDARLQRVMIYGEGSLKIDEGTTLTVGMESQLQGVHLVLERDAELVLLNPKDEIRSLNGVGTLNFYENELTISGDRASSFAGDIKGSGSLILNNGSLELDSTGCELLTLKVNRGKVDLRSTPADFEGISLTEGSELSLGLLPCPCEPQQISLGDDGLSIGPDATLTLVCSPEHMTTYQDPIIESRGPIDLSDGSIIKLKGISFTSSTPTTSPGILLMSSDVPIHRGVVDVLLDHGNSAELVLSPDGRELFCQPC